MSKSAKTGTCADRLARTQVSLEARKKELADARAMLAEIQEQYAESSRRLSEAKELLRLEIESGTRLVRELSAEREQRLALEGERQELVASSDVKWVVALFPLMFPPTWLRRIEEG